MSSHHHLILFHLNVLNHHISSLHFFSAHSSSVTSLFFPSICSLPPTCFRATLSSSFEFNFVSHILGWIAFSNSFDFNFASHILGWIAFSNSFDFNFVSHILGWIAFSNSFDFNFVLHIVGWIAFTILLSLGWIAFNTHCVFAGVCVAQA